ncbi:LuxR family transcriptional regulator [Mangrovihabitans endophyticus]|uniref:HTH luxR-type domain-containing protein n=1 Tax=Mangrovihabitans endophyticus TaxID=1751298 RepID=A0A8J3C5I3_9ACTN|nr:LuxR family transcriptional regulator [Mangrovihabitans endophyticus]GGL12217.1 hypothetical protein GCM10012284_53620 [Mangrovihabitans endophyticus]
MAELHDLITAATTHLRRPGLVVISGPPGCGRTSALRAVAGRLRTAAAGPAAPAGTEPAGTDPSSTGPSSTGPAGTSRPGLAVHAGGGLAMLRAVPGLALSRAVRARLPAHDVHLLAEAVRSRVRGGLLILDDLQYADAATLAAVPLLAPHCRVLVALRTPHRIGQEPLRAAATAWLTVPPLSHDAAAAVARTAAPTLDDDAVARVVHRAGGNPLTLTALARHAASGRGPAGDDIDQVAYALAAALADLPRPARTALAALGLLGRPAPDTLLGAGTADLRAAGLVHGDHDAAQPVSTYLAETAAGLLDPPARADLHRRLAELTPPAEAARHLAAAGEHDAAYRHALTAADQATGGDRAALLRFACDLPGIGPDPRVRLAAADALLATGRPRAAAAVLATIAPLGVEADVLRGEALLQAGDPRGAHAAVRPVPDAAAAPITAARDRVLLLAELATDPDTATDTADKIAARWPQPPPGVAAALAAVHATHRTPGWDTELATAASDTTDPLTSRWSAWQLVEHLAADGRLADAAQAAADAAHHCAADLAYGWQTRFAAAADWALALRGPTLPDQALVTSAGSGPPSPDQATDDHPPDHHGPDAGGADRLHRHATDLTDRAMPDTARAYATAASALLEADAGLLAAARQRLAAAPAHPAVDWVTREAAWLDGQPDRATGPAGRPDRSDLITGLHHITARWAGHDTGHHPPTPIPADLPEPARQTLLAWATGTGFTTAADTWTHTVTRERVRCLLAAGLHDSDPQRAVAALLAAEHLADTAALTVLAGRARRGLRRHHIHRDTRGPRSGSRLTSRETDVLRLVAAGEPTRRIAGQLGISTETVDTHIRAGMRKLGARTRTEAAALAFADMPAPARPSTGRGNR